MTIAISIPFIASATTLVSPLLGVRTPIGLLTVAITSAGMATFLGVMAAQAIG